MKKMGNDVRIQVLTLVNLYAKEKIFLLLKYVIMANMKVRMDNMRSGVEFSQYKRINIKQH